MIAQPNTNELQITKYLFVLNKQLQNTEKYSISQNKNVEVLVTFSTPAYR